MRRAGSRGSRSSRFSRRGSRAARWWISAVAAGISRETYYRWKQKYGGMASARPVGPSSWRRRAVSSSGS
jgi:hypothetical protein